jgi:hypothetical protein
MSRLPELQNVSTIRPKRTVFLKYSLQELIIVILITLVSYLIRGLVPPVLQIVFPAFTCVNLLVLFWEPKDNPETTNLMLMWLIVRRLLLGENQVLHSIDIREFKE